MQWLTHPLPTSWTGQGRRWKNINSKTTRKSIITLDKYQREDIITKENIRIFHKINSTVENEKIPFLQQYGPKSLNFINKKQTIKRIMVENQMLKDKIIQAKSYVTRDDIISHQHRLDRHKRILMEQSPSSRKLDPLSNLSSLLVRSTSRNSYHSGQLELNSPLTLSQSKRNLSYMNNSPREGFNLPDISNKNLAVVKEAPLETTQYNYNFDHSVGRFKYSLGLDYGLSRTVDPSYSSLDRGQPFSLSKLSRYKAQRASENINIDLNKIINNKISTRNFKGEFVPAHSRSKIIYQFSIERNSSFAKGLINNADIIQVRIRQPSTEEFITTQMENQLETQSKYMTIE